MSALPYSFELFPPRNDAAAVRMLEAVDAFAAVEPAFVSVTFGAGGTTSRHSLGVLQRLLDAGVSPMAHLTCTGLGVSDTARLVRQFLDAGITKFLALRGDPPADGVPEPATSLRSAAELVQLIDRVDSERVPYAEVPLPGLRASALAERRCGVEIAVAAFPNGHPGAGVHRGDVDALLAKQEVGATLAITQLFHDPYDYARYVELARARGVTIPIVPGVVIPTSHRRLVRSAQLAGEGLPRVLAERLERATPDEAVAIGVDAAVALIDSLAEHDPPGVHLYTFNDHRPAIDVLHGIGALAPTRTITTGAP
ncbi:5,10-methylenetetrahydrofolate reductase [Agrococcus sediminis]|uniref:Methylenetetrahydrofolate reductase n=1 Tax=Agrococcus sediminis TaxID=2599924 RepID=A0A5M8QPD8_9MICO|nr:methylenetetrahydrofolate reductase [Agrococcus sediminis]KAA6437929.1 5,10-methylenetetrahydrofolate reductase [Agrococcus sediminis]